MDGVEEEGEGEETLEIIDDLVPVKNYNIQKDEKGRPMILETNNSFNPFEVAYKKIKKQIKKEK